MRIPLSWLKTMTEIPSDLNALASMCDMAGLEVEKIDEVGASWDNIVVGEVLSAEPMEGTHLTAVCLGLGSHGERHSMCGAPNIDAHSVGFKVAVAMEGAQFQFTGKNGEQGMLTVEARTVQGKPSEAVICSERELGISEEHGGVYILDDSAVAGTPLVDILGETIIEFELTPDLGRCFSVYGTAREIAALLAQEVDKGQLETEKTGAAGSGTIGVSIDAPELCNRYLGGVIKGVEVGPSPAWMQHRLLSCGLRPLNNIVDISNYVLLEMGQPLHFFDAEKLSGDIQVRLASEGESFSALNGNEYTLSSHALVIADDAGPVAVAGIIGGEDSAVTATTTDILLEAAHFDNHSVRRTTAAIKLRTDAAERFIKDVDPEWTKVAFDRAVKLVLQLCPNARFEGYQDAYPVLPSPATLQLRPKDVTRLLGVEIAEDVIRETLGRFDFIVRDKDGAYEVTAPSYRKDVDCTADLIEEIARAYGLNKIPPAQTGRSYFNQSTFGESLVDAENAIAEVLCGRGFSEAINYSITGEHWNSFGSHFDAPGNEAVRLLNAQSAQRDAMRMTLAPGLIENVAANLRYQSGVHLFEFGRTYFRTADGIQEADMLAWCSAGALRPPFWGDQSVGTAHGLEYNLHDLKGILVAILARMGLHSVTFGSLQSDSMTAGQAFSVHLGDKQIGFIGEVDPDTASKYGVEDMSVFAGELLLSALVEARDGQAIHFTPLATQPSIQRDLSVLVQKSVEVGALLDTVRRSAGELLEELHLFDRYTGKGVDDSSHSLAMTLTFRHGERTLRAEEVDSCMDAVIKALDSTHNATLRG